MQLGDLKEEMDSEQNLRNVSDIYIFINNRALIFSFGLACLPKGNKLNQRAPGKMLKNPLNGNVNFYKYFNSNKKTLKQAKKRKKKKKTCFLFISCSCVDSI